MSARVSLAQRISLQNRAEVEIHRFEDHALWHKHVQNITLDPIQHLKMDLMDEHDFTVDPSCRRTRKTSTKELYHLKKMACEGDHELSIVAPKFDQSKVNLKYHTDGIRASEILSAYIAIKEGKRRISDTSYEFANRSVAKTYGIMSKMDGMDTTIADVEEIDDINKERLWSRYMLTLQGTERLFSKKQGKIKKTGRFTGVFQGLDLMSDLVRKAKHHPLNCKYMVPMLKALGVSPEDALSGSSMEGFQFYCLPVIDQHLGISVGIINASVVNMVREDLNDDQILRQLLCIPTEGRNFFKDKYLRLMMQRGSMAGCEPEMPVPGKHYEKRGLVFLGFDKGGHGESEAASKNTAHVFEAWGNYVVWLWGAEWDADADDAPIIRQLVEWHKFFKFDGGHGDAYGASLIANLNDELYSRGLIDIDRNEFGGSSASTWSKWFIKPIRMEGFQKHLMFTALESAIREGRMVTPYIHEGNTERPGYDVLHRTVKQFGNIKAENTSKSYNSYQMVKKKTGDDNVDGWTFGYWSLVARGIIEPPTVMLTSTKTREQLLGI